MTKDDGLQLDDMEWLSDGTTDTMTSKKFTLTGFEKLQNAFESMEPDSENLQQARNCSEQIIILRFMELMRTAHLKGEEKNLSWSTIPIYFTEHSYDFILISDN